MNTVTQLPFVVVGMVAGGLQLGSPAGSEDVRAVGGAVDLHRGEEPAIKTRRLVVILLGDAQRLAVLVVVRGPPVRGHSVVEQFAAVGVWRSRRTCSTQAASARWGIHWSSCEIFVPKSAS